MASIQESIFKVVYNDKHGGFGMNKKGLDEYNRRTSKELKYADGIHRSDPILIDLVETMGNDINDACSKLKIKEFLIKYKGFLKWNEYDGKESVSINYDKYLIYHMKCVKDSKKKADEKVLEIEELYKEYDERSKSYLDRYIEED